MHTYHSTTIEYRTSYIIQENSQEHESRETHTYHVAKANILVRGKLFH